jgi:hypothetical protein
MSWGVAEGQGKEAWSSKVIDDGGGGYISFINT